MTCTLEEVSILYPENDCFPHQ